MLPLLTSAHSTATLIELPLRPQRSSLISPGVQRGLATRQASKPKAHTGRATGSSKPKSTTTARKATTKSSANPKSKKVKRRAKPKAKPKAKRRVRAKKPQTAEEKEKADKKARNVTIRDLRKAALEPPRELPQTAYTVLNSEIAKAQKGINGSESAQKYRNLVPDELEVRNLVLPGTPFPFFLTSSLSEYSSFLIPAQHYNHLANENKAKNQLAYDQWVKSLTPDAIRAANNARLRLKRLGIKSRPPIKDDRMPKRHVPSQAIFLKDRFASGDMRGMATQDAFKIILREWKELPVAEKQVSSWNSQLHDLPHATVVRDGY